MRNGLAKLTSAAVATALVFASSAAFAESQAPATAPQAQSSWAALSMLSPVGGMDIGAMAATAAAQPVPPPPPVREYGSLPPPPIPVIMVWLATLLTMVYIATRNDHHEAPVPNSPF